MRLEKYSENDKHYYRLIADNNRTLMTSRPYGRKDARDHAFNVIDKAVWAAEEPDDIE